MSEQRFKVTFEVTVYRPSKPMNAVELLEGISVNWHSGIANKLLGGKVISVTELPSPQIVEAAKNAIKASTWAVEDIAAELHRVLAHVVNGDRNHPIVLALVYALRNRVETRSQYDIEDEVNRLATGKVAHE